MEGTYVWTRHSQYKLQQYALSEQRVRRVIRHPDRVEKSIVPKMVAVMQIAGTSKNRQEIWAMYEIVKSQKLQAKSRGTKLGGEISNPKSKIQNIKLERFSPAQKFRLQRQQEFLAKNCLGEGNTKTLRIVSVWRYPGTSPERDPIPEDIMEELRDMA